MRNLPNVESRRKDDTATARTTPKMSINTWIDVEL
jgi:hypothetical protein